MSVKTYTVDGMTIYDHSDEVQLADNALKNQRSNICNSCEFKLNDSCSQCGCLLVVKVSLLNNRCPMEKW